MAGSETGTAPESSVAIATLLTVSGGFLDAFSYVGHGGVFATAMTGNVILLGVAAASGAWKQAARHLAPLGAFMVGVAVARALQLSRVRPYVRRPALACLGIEITVLTAATWLPVSFPDSWLVLMIALVAAMQNSSFTRIHGWPYNSTMTTGNLRRFAEGLFTGVAERDAEARQQGLVFGLICLCFLGGALVGAFTTPRLGNRALWLPVAMLLGAALLLLRLDRTTRLSPEAR